MSDSRRSPIDPIISRQGAGHWAAAREGKLALQHCKDCGAHIFYPSFVCDRCLSTNLDWAVVSGHGTVESFTTVYRAFAEEFASDVPYTVALVRLDEGVNLLSWLIDIAPEEARIGMPVEVTFEKKSDTISLHRFRPVTT